MKAFEKLEQRYTDPKTKELSEENMKTLFRMIIGKVDMYTSRDPTEANRHVWMLYHIYKFVNQAISNYKMKYCENWKPSYRLVLQQPESEGRAHRMNYLIDDYDGGKSWRGA